MFQKLRNSSSNALKQQQKQHQKQQQQQQNRKFNLLLWLIPFCRDINGMNCNNSNN
jgi:hypothetical protein